MSELEGPLTAAEVMMEFPAQFLSCISNAMSSGRRITAVPAHEELRASELYLVLPMHKLNMRFSEEEMAVFASLEAATKDSGKKQSSGANSQRKVAPLPVSMASTQSPNREGLGVHAMRSPSFVPMNGAVHEDLERSAASLCMMGAPKNAVCRSKSWIPRLDTIRECAVAS